MDGGNTPFIGLLSPIVKPKHVNVGNGSCIFGALQNWYQSQVEIVWRKVELEILG